MIREYFEDQDKYVQEYGPKTILISQCGGFYEIYGVDNGNPDDKQGIIYEIVEITNLNVSKRKNKFDPVSIKNPLMAGFPVHSFDKWKNILTNKGYTVIQQVQEDSGYITTNDPKSRRVIMIHSPGIDLDTNSKTSNNLMSIFLEMIKYQNKMILYAGLSVIDVSTGENMVYEIESPKNDMNFTLDELFRLIQTHNPQEIIINTENMTENMGKEELYKYLELNDILIHYNNYKSNKNLLKNKEEILKKAFPNTGLLSVVEYLGLERKYFGLNSYIFLLQFAYSHCESFIEKLLKPQVDGKSKFLNLSHDSINQLNMIPNKNLKINHSIDSLWNLIDKTSTCMGKRFLKENLLKPILNIEELNKRYNLTELFVQDKLFLKLEKIMNPILDITRLHRKITMKILNPGSFINLDMSYGYINKIIHFLENIKHPKIHELLPSKTVLNKFTQFIQDYNAKLDMSIIHGKTRADLTTSIFKQGIFPEIDILQNKINNLNGFFSKLGKIISKMIMNAKPKPKNKPKNPPTPINIEVKINNTANDKSCIYPTSTGRVELFKKALKKIKIIEVPMDDGTIIKIKTSSFTFKSSKSVSKIACPEMNNYGEKIHFYHYKMEKLCIEKFISLLDYFSNQYNETWQKIETFIAYLDFIKSNAKSAFMYQYCKPIIHDKLEGKSYIMAKNVRHPILEAINTKLEYIPNNIDLGNKINGMLLYGVNAVGKSSYMKSVGLAIVMAQAGLFVPAQTFEYHPYTQIFTRISGNDNIFKNQSTFGVEMSELRSILCRADKNSLVLGDELCSGTETVSGLALVAAGVITLDRLNSSFIFATHLHQLSKMERLKKVEGVKNYHMETIYDEKNEKLIYDRKIRDGSGNAIYGLEVAKAMDLKRDFIYLANQIRKEVLEIDHNIVSEKTSIYNANVSLNTCKMCLKQKATEVHHMKPQRLADENGVIDHHHKNAEHNLVPLCHDCHQRVENGDVETKGYIQTSNGIELNTVCLTEQELSHKKKKRKKYNDGDVQTILSLKSSQIDDSIQKGEYIKAKKILELHHNLIVSTGIIKKIWNGTY